MASRVVMPKLSDTMEEGRILRWLKKEGETIETGQALAEVETDKATVEMESYTNGVIRKLIAPEGQVIKVGQLIAIVGASGEDIAALLSETTASATAPPPPPAPGLAATPRPAPLQDVARSRQSAAEPEAGGRSLRASPLALRMAAEAGVDVNSLEGTGPQGRIIKRDIEAARARAAAPAESMAGALPARRRTLAFRAANEAGADRTEVELNNIRRTIAKRLVQSKGPVPHFYLTIDVAMDRVWEAYEALRGERSSITINDIVVKATALALSHHPELNASFGGDHVTRYSRVHVGLAVAIDDGLITPVIRDADIKSLEEISEESRTLAERARARKLQPDEYTGATFSISNLGMMGIEEFSAIINPPEAAILAVGAVREVPVVVEGTLGIGRRMKLTLSVDHRVADGAMGARFLQTLQRYLEHPLLMA